MRIISDFQDYYDNIQGFGIDKDLVYVRYTKELGKIDIKPHHEYFTSKYNCTIERSFFVLGFCGKIYPVIRADIVHSIGYKYSIDTYRKTNYAFSTNDLIRIAEKHEVDPARLVKLSAGSFTDRTDYFEKDQSIHKMTFQKYKCPIFIATGSGVILNPRLKDLDFFKIIDPFTAFQEIAMYISGVLGVNEPETVAISDKMMAKKKGFDKQSFRTPSPGKKANRWK